MVNRNESRARAPINARRPFGHAHRGQPPYDRLLGPIWPEGIARDLARGASSPGLGLVDIGLEGLNLFHVTVGEFAIVRDEARSVGCFGAVRCPNDTYQGCSFSMSQHREYSRSVALALGNAKSRGPGNEPLALLKSPRANLLTTFAR